MRTYILIVLSTLLYGTAAAQANEAQSSTALAAGTSWAQPFFTRLDISFAGGSFHARWDISRCSCGDLHIVAEETLPQEIRRGEQLLLDGSALLVRGYEGHEGPLSPLVDSPVLMMQLLFMLLQKTESSGPSTVTAALKAEISEPALPIELDTGTAFGLFPAPWSLSGTVGPNADGRIQFELNFEFSLRTDAQQVISEHIKLSGLVDYKEKAFPVADSIMLDDWSLNWLHPSDAERPTLETGMNLGQYRAKLKEMGSE